MIDPSLPARPHLRYRLADRAVRSYFDASYGLLLGSPAGRRTLAAAADGGPQVHGYLTPEDYEELLEQLRPSPADRLLDLGCGTGGLALAVHRATGAEVLGIDVSSRAVAAAGRSAGAAGMHPAVRFAVGSLTCPPGIGASGAFAIDSLMFAPDLCAALNGIGRALVPGGRLFATMLVTGTDAEQQVRRAVAASGGSIEVLDDVTPALASRSRRRVGAAVAVRRIGAGSFRGELATRLVSIEESVVQRLVSRGRLGRWRFVVRFREDPAT